MSDRVVVLAQDLIWADRLARAVEAAGAEPVRVASLQRFEEALADIDAAIVDLTALAYDGLAAIEAASDCGRARARRRPARRPRAPQACPGAPGPTACTPTASCSRTGRRRSRPGWVARPRSGRDHRHAPDHPGARAIAERLQRAGAATAAAGLDALFIGVGSDLRYLTGYEAMPLERLTMLVLRPGQDPFVVVPGWSAAPPRPGCGHRSRS